MLDLRAHIGQLKGKVDTRRAAEDASLRKLVTGSLASQLISSLMLPE